MSRMKYVKIIFGALVAMLIYGVVVVVTSVTVSSAYDVPEVVDRPFEQSRSLESQNYRFGPIKDEFSEYSDGSVVPSRTFAIEWWNETSQQWENIGYSNTHLHKVKVDETDVFDVSVGTTNRINPKH